MRRERGCFGKRPFGFGGVRLEATRMVLWHCHGRNLVDCSLRLVEEQMTSVAITGICMTRTMIALTCTARYPDAHIRYQPVG